MCLDGVRSGTETAPDCGGSCSPCNDGLACSLNSDCQSRVCKGGICASSSCGDGATNGTETGIDCGGSCSPCPNGSPCSSKTDCVSAVCFYGRCASPMPDFTSARVHAPGSYANHGASADFDRDGDRDVLVINADDARPSVSLLRNDGTGRFELAGAFATGAPPRWVVVADMNRDGKTDALVSTYGKTNNHSDASIDVCLNDGNGAFVASQSVTVPLAGRPVVGDIDSDGDNDVVVPGFDMYGSVYVTVLSNDSVGRLSLRQSIESRARSVQLADTDQDGDLDLIAAEYPGALSVFPNAGGTFGKASSESSVSVGSEFSELSVGDLNADGFPDLFLAANQGFSCVALNDRTGHFPSCVALGNSRATAPAQLVDVDSNGTLDIVMPTDSLIDPVSRNGSWGLLLSHNQGNGVAFTNENLYLSQVPAWAELADWDGDCRLDIGYGSASTFRTLSNHGHGAFDSAEFGGAWTSEHLAIVDLNADGLMDLVGVSADGGGTGSLVVAVNQNGQVRNSTGYPSIPFTGTPSYPVAADFNADGHPDLAMVFPFANAVGVALGSGGAAFSSPVKFDTACRAPVALSTADVNADTKLDLLVACEGEQGMFPIQPGLSVHVGSGDGGFGSPTYYPYGILHGARLESLGPNGGRVLVLLGSSGIGIVTPFASENSIQWILPGAFNALEIADLDSDGKLDIAATEVSVGSVVVLWNDGNGMFTTGNLMGTHPRPYAIAIDDLNGDTRPDLAVTQASTQSLRLLCNTGNRTFVEKRDYEALGTSRDIVNIVDLDRDGSKDIIVGGDGTRVLRARLREAPLPCPTCSDGNVREPEICDDGNRTDADGCSSTCQLESGFSCAGLPSVCSPICGDGVLRTSELCDDHNATSGDGCSSACQVEPGFNCTPNAAHASVCTAGCGDGRVTGDEVCDDGNRTDGDGCASTCRHDLWARLTVDAQTITDVAVGPTDGPVIVGSFQGSVDFGNGPVAAAANASELFVARYDATGHLSWVRHFPGNYYNRITGVAVDSSGAVVITGTYMSTLTFGTPALPDPGYVGGFLVKLDAAGQHVYSRAFIGSGATSPTDITVDTNRAVFVTGGFSGNANFGGATLASAGGTDLFIVKFDTNGNHMASASYGNETDQTGKYAATDSNGNLWITDTYRGQLT
ncbi:MAG TPA: FG-GAP-like repeat-containing protein, partial [Polyangiaceae bacterium]